MSTSKIKTSYEVTHARFGFVISLLLASLTIIALALAVTTPPLSGPFCTGDCFKYPYSEILSRFPRDYYWMYPTMLIPILFILQMIAVHYYADGAKKIYSQIGISFAILAAVVLLPNYYIQVSVVQASLMNGETEGIALLTQFNPHGIFIALEEVGFLTMSIALCAIVPVFTARDAVSKTIRVIYIVGFLATLFSFIFISIKYGVKREYIFEVTIISILWLELIISSILLGVVFKRRLDEFKGVSD